MTNEEWMLVNEAKRLVDQPNDPTTGSDSRKREIALQLIAGLSIGNGGNGKQTDRLLRLAIALTEARG